MDQGDANRLSMELVSGSHQPSFDLTTDSRVDGEDLHYWIRYVARTWTGDANLGGQFNSSDLVQVLEAGKYQRDIQALWSEGDWTGDGRFDRSDLIAALQEGGFETGTRRALTAVSEPSTVVLLLASALCVLIEFARRRRAAVVRPHGAAVARNWNCSSDRPSW